MDHFNCKSLAIYGVAISSVLLLFKSVTVFGENHLQAPPKISDRYRLHMAKNLPNCKKSPDLVLNIQQSGIYVNASLFPANTNTNISAIKYHQKSLTGILKNQQLYLSGKIDISILCATTHAQANAVYSATMRMQLRDKNRFTGQLIISSISPNLKFTAIPNHQSPLNTINHE